MVNKKCNGNGNRNCYKMVKNGPYSKYDKW